MLIPVYSKWTVVIVVPVCWAMGEEDWFVESQAQNISSKYELLMLTLAIMQYNQAQLEDFLDSEEEEDERYNPHISADPDHSDMDIDQGSEDDRDVVHEPLTEFDGEAFEYELDSDDYIETMLGYHFGYVRVTNTLCIN